MKFESMFLVFALQIILTFSLSAAVTQPELENFAAAVTNFSSELYLKCVESTSENVVISPYSAVNAIVVLSQATNGKALDQLKSALNFTGSESDLLNSYVAYQQSLTESARQSTMILANKLYVREGYQINPKFKETANQKLLSDVELVDFKNSNETAKIINDFANEAIQNRTGDIIKPEQLNADTQIILINTIYMRLVWEKVYQSIEINNDRQNKFSIFKGDSITTYNDIEYVKFNDGRFKYAELNESDTQVLEIRFADSDFSLLLILPGDMKSLAKLEANMRDDDLAKIIDLLKPERVDLRIPTLQLKYQFNLKNIAKKIQIANIFEKDKVNMSGLLNNDTLTSISDVILTTVIEIEPGNSADEKTDKFLSSLSKLDSGTYKKYFEADRPFLYHIWDRKLKTAILSGSLKEFEGKKSKRVYRTKGDNRSECFEADGKKVTCLELRSG